MELAGHRPDPLSERRLDVQVNILEGRVPSQGPALGVAAKAGQGLGERGHLVLGQDSGPAEATHMGDRPVDVVEGELGVDVDGAPKGRRIVERIRLELDRLRRPVVRTGSEPPAPESHRTSLASDRGTATSDRNHAVIRPDPAGSSVRAGAADLQRRRRRSCSGRCRPHAASGLEH